MGGSKCDRVMIATVGRSAVILSTKSHAVHAGVLTSSAGKLTYHRPSRVHLHRFPSSLIDPAFRFTRQWKQAARRRNKEATNQSSEAEGLVSKQGSSVPSPATSLHTHASFSNGTQAARSSSTIHGQPSVVGNDVIISQDLVRSGLSQFISFGVSSSSWDVFDQPERVRIAYIGTELSNFTHLVGLEQTGSTELHHPYPHIKPPLPWKPDADSRNNLQSPNLILDLCSFPARDVRDDLVESFFTNIHPYFPIIDEHQFRAQYGNPQDPPPLILLQSVLLAGAHASHHPRVAQARSTVMAVLFRRAKTLFDMRHENDRLNLIQAALLFSWHIENADSVSSNSWYWAGVACRIAFGIGMHRNLSRYSVGRFPDKDRRLYRRVWWSLFQVEIMSALEHGRPCMIRIEDFDQPLLEMDDLRDADGVVNPNISYRYCAQKIELCYIALEISRLSSPGMMGHAIHGSVQSVNSRLVGWALMNPSGTDYESLSLHIFYQTLVIHWHRTSINTRVVGLTQSTEICKGASKSILGNYESLAVQNLIHKCHFTDVISITAAAIQTHKEIKNAIEQRQTLQAINAINDLERVLRVAKAMADYWPNAEAVYKLFKGLLDKLKASASHNDALLSNNHPFDENDNGWGDLNWHEILTYQTLEQPLNEGWLNNLPDDNGGGLDLPE